MTRCVSILAILAVLMSGSVLRAAKGRSSITDYLFSEQSLAVRDPAPFKLLWTTGRAGKSTCILCDFVDKGLQKPHTVYFYFALTMAQVEEVAWPTLQQINRDFRLGCRFQEQKLRVTLPGGSWIRLFGCDRHLALDRFFGIKLAGAAIDEAAHYSTIDVEKFVMGTLGPRLLDQGGQLYLASTPPEYPRGLFWEIIKGFGKRRNMAGADSPSKPGWSVHSWTTENNPAMRGKFIAEKNRLIAADPKVVDRAWFRREYLGEAVQERGSRVYEFDPEKNTYRNSESESVWGMGAGDNYVLGIDFGWEDSTAFSLNVWRSDSPVLVEILSEKQKQMRMDDIAARIVSLQDMCGGEDRLTIVGDYSSRQYFEELRRRYMLPIMEAERWDKYQWIEIWNNDSFLGNVQVVDPDSSPHVEEITALNWKYIRQTGKRVEQPGAPNDCCDAHLQAYRHAYHYLHEEEEPPIEVGTEKYYQEVARRIDAEIDAEEEAEERDSAWYE